MRVMWATVAVVGLLIIGILALPLPIAPYRSTEFERWVCRGCGLENQTVSCRFFGILYSRSEKQKVTPLAEALAAASGKAHAHAWVRTYFDYHSRIERGHGGLGVGVTLHMLVYDPRTVTGMVQYATAQGVGPNDVWSSVLSYYEIAAGNRSNILDQWVERWVSSGGDPNFDALLVQSYPQMAALVATHAHRDPQQSAAPLSGPIPSRER